jgi:PKD repeat protein
MKGDSYFASGNDYAPARCTIIAMCFLSLAVMPCKAQVQGPKNPTAAIEQFATCLACPGSLWNNLSNVDVSDGSFATTTLSVYSHCFSSQCYTCRGLIASGFGFNIPTTAAISGIVVNIERKADTLNAIIDSVVSLTRNDTIQGVNLSMPATWDTSNHYTNYGNSGYLWGHNWTPAEINLSGFGVLLKMVNHSTTSQVTAYVDNINVTVYYTLPGSPPVAAFGASDTVICPGASVQFTDESSNNPTQWYWQFQGGNPSSSTAQNPLVTYASAGTYTVTMVAADSSGSDTLIKSNYIVVSPNPTIQISNDTSICTGSSVQLEALGGVAYQWAPCAGLSNCVDSITSAQPTTTTIYTVTVTGITGCTATDSVTVSVDSLPPQPVITVSGVMLTSSAAAGNQWKLNDSIIPGATGNEYTATVSGFYSVQVINANGCSSVSNAVQVTVSGVSTTGLPEAGFAIFPNPVSDILQIRVSGINATGCAVYTINGEKIYESLQHAYLNTANFIPGLYFIEIKSAQGTFRARFVKE